MKNAILLFQFFLLIFLISCKKDTDEVFPVISLSSPNENSHFDVLDDVVIRAKVSDNELIKQVQVGLFESVSNRQVLTVYSYEPLSSTFDLELTYPISDSLLPSGQYYFKIEAKDNENATTVFQHIFINGIRKEIIGVFAICSNANTTTLYSDKNDLNFEVYSTLSEPFFASEINSYDQQLWLLPKSNGNVTAMRLTKKQIEFEQSKNSNYSEAYTDLSINERAIFYSTREGDVWGYSSNYAQNYYYQSLSSRTINSLKVGTKYILIDEVDLVGTNRFANVLYRNTGIVKTGISINYPVEEFYFIEEEKALLFQNDENGGRVSELDILAGARRTVSTFPDSILNVEQVSTVEYLISTPTKVLRYNSKNGNVLDYLLLPMAVITYDSLNKQVYVASGNQLEVYNYPLNVVVGSALLPDEIKGINIRYNK